MGMTHRQLRVALRLLLEGRVGRGEPASAGGECSSGDDGSHGRFFVLVCLCFRRRRRSFRSRWTRLELSRSCRALFRYGYIPR